MKMKNIRWLLVTIVLMANVIAISLAKYSTKLNIAELSLDVKYNTTLTSGNADESVNEGYVITQVSSGSFEDVTITEEMNGWAKGTVDGWMTTSEHFELVYNGSPNSDPYQYVESSPYGDYFIEMNAETEDIYYQDIDTKSGDVIEWSLIHSTRNTTNVYTDEQSMAVIVGQPNGTPTKTVIDETTLEVTIDEAIKDGTKARWESTGLVAGSKYGFAIPKECTALSLVKGSGWEEAKGVYVVPDGQTKTRFSFLALSGGAGGNFLDGVKFTTLLGNVNIEYDETTGIFTITGYWTHDAEKNQNKGLVYYFKDKNGNNIIDGKIDMSILTGNHFKIEFKRIFNEEVTLEVYHEDYQPPYEVVSGVSVMSLNKFDSVEENNILENTDNIDNLEFNEEESLEENVEANEEIEENNTVEEVQNDTNTIEDIVETNEEVEQNIEQNQEVNEELELETNIVTDIQESNEETQGNSETEDDSYNARDG